ncbi:capsule assembly Wzi family protein [Algoriphagus ornithinivorans]|uniref:capsule assembly Wzi family protein n=1 Tax=Algoriphagus ornithinivorans TaxID=226506 RepID=UPI0015881049|nr:hypothetical protein [Algoriphagus ornithinivorans]
MTKRPYGFGDGSLIPTPGLQISILSGINAKWRFIYLDIQPELFFSTNSQFAGYSSDFSNTVNRDKFYFWNNSDYPERFGNGVYSRLGWGQSSLTFRYGSFETGVSTKNLWWGPGQWNSLIFSTNAPGFPHLTFKTFKPAKTFLGFFEGEIIAGRLENSGFDAVQDEELNDLFFRPFTGDWRYLNGITLTYSPKWTKGLSFGFSRTFQVYSQQMGNTFSDYLPIFEAFQKESFFQDGNSVIFDGNGRDQQISIFAKVVIPKVKTDLYFEFGKRDHNFNWREFILNPEHARAFIFGFNQMLNYKYKDYQLQLRGEIVHQQESVNRIVRYGPKGGLAWHTHTRARGFSHLGQPLGVGLGIGSNSQTLEVAMVENLNKFGFLIERLENHQDFYYRAFGTDSERKPWIDLSLGFLYDKKFKNLLLSSKLQLIHARNYQWQLDPASSPDFPKGKNLTSVMGQVSAIYFWNKKKD